MNFRNVPQFRYKEKKVLTVRKINNSTIDSHIVSIGKKKNGDVTATVFGRFYFIVGVTVTE